MAATPLRCAGATSAFCAKTPGTPEAERGVGGGADEEDERDAGGGPVRLKSCVLAVEEGVATGLFANNDCCAWRRDAARLATARAERASTLAALAAAGINGAEAAGVACSAGIGGGDPGTTVGIRAGA